MYYGQIIDMPPKELELLYFLASSPNQVFTREQLLDNIWGYEYLGDQFFGIKWFNDVVICTKFQSQHFVKDFPFGEMALKFLSILNKGGPYGSQTKNPHRRRRCQYC